MSGQSATQSATQSNRASIAALMTALIAACIAFQLNASMLAPVLVTMGKELDANQAVIGLSQTSFFASAALFSVFLPRLSDTVGRKKILVGMMVILTAGSILAALAPNVAILYVARIIQGVAGPVVPLCLLILRVEITDAKRYGTMLGVVTATNGGIAGIDVLAGGFLASSFGFRSVFWLITIVAVIATVLVFAWGRESIPSQGTRMDWIGVAPLVVSVVAFLVALDEAGKLAAANLIFIAVMIVIAVIAFIVFWQVEKRSKHPLVSTEEMKQRSTWGLLLTTLLTLTGVYATVNGVLIGFAQNTHAGFGISPGVASLIFLTPFALVGWAVGPFAGRFSATLGYRRVLRVGLIGSIIAIGLMTFLGLHSLPWLIAATVLIGITYAGVVNIVLNGLGIVLSPKDNPGILPGLNASAFNLGAGLSFVILPAVEVIGTPAGSFSTSGYFVAMLVGLVITAGALAASFLIPKPLDAEVEKQQTHA
jgi:MFS family permease